MSFHVTFSCLSQSSTCNHPMIKQPLVGFFFMLNSEEKTSVFFLNRVWCAKMEQRVWTVRSCTVQLFSSVFCVFAGPPVFFRLLFLYSSLVSLFLWTSCPLFYTFVSSYWIFVSYLKNIKLIKGILTNFVQ